MTQNVCSHCGQATRLVRTILPLGPAWPGDQVEELRSLLQIDNVAPVDNASFGKRLAEIIVRASNVVKPRRGK
jgi:hypothetical protein